MKHKYNIQNGTNRKIYTLSKNLTNPFWVLLYGNDEPKREKWNFTDYLWISNFDFSLVLNVETNKLILYEIDNEALSVAEKTLNVTFPVVSSLPKQTK